AGDRRPVLPAMRVAVHRAWPARVDRGAPSSYSPFNVGPPAYRAVRLRYEPSIPVYRTLD
ncbi:MAG: hypothetical protein ACOCVZ_06170, partial [Gemmatimonadota bacterium]